MIWIISLLSAFGMAVIIVEKGEEGPQKYIVSFAKKNLKIIFSPNAINKLFDCSVCVSFWTALISDISLFFYTDMKYFLWPLSGFIACGFAWIIYEMFYIIDNNEEN